VLPKPTTVAKGIVKLEVIMVLEGEGIKRASTQALSDLEKKLDQGVRHTV
jgi:hypothetical protein